MSYYDTYSYKEREGPGKLEKMQTDGVRAATDFLTDEKDGLAGMLGLPPVLMSGLGMVMEIASIFGGISGGSMLQKNLERPWVKSAMERVGIKDTAQAARKAKAGFLFTAPFLPEFFRGVKVTRTHLREMRELTGRVKNLLAANKRAGIGATSINSGNLILKHARAQVIKNTGNGMKNWFANAINTYPKYKMARAEYDIDLLRAKFNETTDKMERAAIKKRRKKILAQQEKMKHAMYVLTGSGGALETYMNNKLQHEEIDPTPSLAMCEEFAEYMQGQLSRAQAGGERVKQMVMRDAVQKVAAIFMKVRQENNMPNMTELMEEQFEAAMFAIADKIVNGEIHPMAIINLAGDRKIMQRSAIANEEQVKAVLREQSVVASPQQMESAKEFADKVGFSIRDLVNSFKKLPKSEQLFYSMMAPDNLLVAAGMKPKQIRKMRKQVEGKVNHLLASAILNIASVDEMPLREAGLTKREIAIFREMAGSIAAHNNLDEMYFGPQVKKMVLRAGMALGSKGGAQAWQAIFDSGILAQVREKAARNAVQENKPRFTDMVEKEGRASSRRHGSRIKGGSHRSQAHISPF